MENIISYKNRVLDKTKPIKIYRCLTRKGKWYSIQQKGLVVAHTTNIKLRDIEFKINLKGKERAIKEQTRNVHAYIVGYYTENKQIKIKTNKITYNPFKNKGFYRIDNNQEINNAKFCIINQKGVNIY